MTSPASKPRAKAATAGPAKAEAAPSVARLKNWVIDDALPLWGETGFDAERGSFVERLTFEGAPIHAAPRRAMVQARQIYVFSHAALLGWRPQGAPIALEAAHRLIDRYHGSDGGHGWVFSVHADGAVHDARRDFYAHSFALFGLAWAYKLAPEPRFLSTALATLSVLDRHFESPTGGYHSALPADPAKREQNPHMHLFEAMLAWFEATGREMFLARAAELYGMMAARFFQHETGILAEYFDGGWNPREGVHGRICEPGHHFEWSWLLRRYAKLSGRRDSPIAEKLKAFGDRHGFDAEGFVVDELLDDGRVHKPSRRSWPHTEAIKAEAAAAELGDEEAAGARGADDRPALRHLSRPPRRGRLDRPCRCEGRAARRRHAGEHALSRLSRSRRSGPGLGRAGKAAGRQAMSEAIRQALILAGGRGTRLGAITEAIPKPMLRIAGDKPFLDYLIEMIERHGYDDIILLGGYLGEVLEAAYDGRRIGGARLRVLREKAPLGTAGALTIARETLDPRFLMMNGDAFFDINLRALEQAALEGGAMATLALRSVPDAARYGRVIEEQGKVVAFLEKDPSRPGPGIINGGIYVLKREILDLVSALPSSLEQDVFPALVERGEIRGKAFDGYFLDIGLPETLEQGHRELPNVRVRPAAFFDRRALMGGGEGDSFGRVSMDGRRGRGHSRAQRSRLLCFRHERRGERRRRLERGDAGVPRGRRGACRPVHTARPALPQALCPAPRGARPGRPARSPKPWTNGRSCGKNPSSLARARATSRRPAARASRLIRLTAAIWRASSKGSWRDRRKAERPWLVGSAGRHPPGAART